MHIFYFFWIFFKCVCKFAKILTSLWNVLKFEVFPPKNWDCNWGLPLQAWMLVVVVVVVVAVVVVVVLDAAAVERAAAVAAVKAVAAVAVVEGVVVV